MRKALVTGGGGFLGSAIVTRLCDLGWQVVTINRGRYAKLDSLGVEQQQGDIANPDLVSAAAEGCTAVFHVAAKAGVWGTRSEYYSANVTGTENVIDACRRHGIGKLVYTSTPSVIHTGGDVEGIDESAPYAEEYEAPYPETKAIAEQAVLAANSHELVTVALRPHLIWGPEDTNLVPRIVARQKAGRLRLIGDADKLVDSTYIDTAADAHLLAHDRLQLGAPCCGRAYFISQGEPLAIGELINRILDAAGLPPVKKTISPGAAYAAGAVMETFFGLLRIKSEPQMTRFLARQLATAHWYDISAARRDLGFEPKVSIDEGIERLRAWFTAQRDCSEE
jgi:nucleoside-diphosphate-sugar epimerase